MLVQFASTEIPCEEVDDKLIGLFSLLTSQKVTGNALVIVGRPLPVRLKNQTFVPFGTIKVLVPRVTDVSEFHLIFGILSGKRSSH